MITYNKGEFNVKNDKNENIAIKSQIVVLEMLIKLALDKFYQNDKYLLDKGVHERSCVFRFAHYLQNLMDESSLFHDYNLDFEYNRNGRFSKSTSTHLNGTYPDLIIHKRGSNDYNLLIIEFKTYWNSDISRDINKLSEFIDENEKYKYQCARIIILNRTREDVKIVDVHSLPQKQELSETTNHKITTLDIIIEAMQNLGGECKYIDLYQEYESITGKKLTTGQKADIRKCIEVNSSDSDSFQGNDIFYSVEGKHKGYWGLRKNDK